MKSHVIWKHATSTHMFMIGKPTFINVTLVYKFLLARLELQQCYQVLVKLKKRGKEQKW